MSRLSDVTNLALTNLLGFRNLTLGAAAANLKATAAASATFDSTTAISYINNGVVKYKAALSAVRARWTAPRLGLPEWQAGEPGRLD